MNIFYFFVAVFLVGKVCSTPISIDSLKNNDALVSQWILKALSEEKYHPIQDVVDIQYKPALIIGVVDTACGKKFLKLHSHPEGENEYLGGCLLDQYVHTIKAEQVICKEGIDIVVQPYVQEAAVEGGMLFDWIWAEEKASNPLFWPLIDHLCAKTFSLMKDTLHYTVQPVRNDRLYCARLKTKKQDGTSGRIESYYTGSLWNLSGHRIFWEDLIKKRWVIDGVEYVESLEELLELVQRTLQPLHARCIAITHGDWHDMNMHVSVDSDGIPRYAFLDCELSGYNEVIGDIMVYLIYDAIQGDYLTPKYFPIQFKERPERLHIAKEQFLYKERSISISHEEGSIRLDGIKQFGTSDTRKKIAAKLLDKLFFPITLLCQEMGNNDVESTIKATLFMRLMGVYNVSTLDPMDQSKIIGLLYKSIGTPKHATQPSSTLNNFLQAL